MNTMTIDNVAIGDGKKTFIIAEGCDNHMGNMETAREMCRLAKLAGADCIKFQHHLPDEEMLKDVPMSSNFDIPLYDFLKLREPMMYLLKPEWSSRLRIACQSIRQNMKMLT